MDWRARRYVAFNSLEIHVAMTMGIICMDMYMRNAIDRMGSWSPIDLSWDGRNCGGVRQCHKVGTLVFLSWEARPRTITLTGLYRCSLGVQLNRYEGCSHWNSINCMAS